MPARLALLGAPPAALTPVPGTSPIGALTGTIGSHSAPSRETRDLGVRSGCAVAREMLALRAWATHWHRFSEKLEVRLCGPTPSRHAGIITRSSPCRNPQT